MFAREFPRVARTVHHVVGDRARAEEVTQDAFLELLRHWGKVSAYDRPDLWVRRVAIRKAQRERSRSWRRTGASNVPSPPPTAPSRRRRRPRCWPPYGDSHPSSVPCSALFYFDDRPMAEIAEIVGCSESTGWSQLHTARRHLAAALSEEVTDDVR